MLNEVHSKRLIELVLSYVSLSFFGQIKGDMEKATKLLAGVLDDKFNAGYWEGYRDGIRKGKETK